MAGRETAHYFQAGMIVKTIERGAVKFVLVAEGAAGCDAGGERLRPEEV